MSNNDTNKENVYEWIKKEIPKFKEWYQPVDFGNGVIAHQTVPPYWDARPDLLNHIEGGMAKWNYIIKKHLPDVKDKRCLDIGCSSGLFCLEMAKLGAREVIGIDRDENISHKSTSVPPSQNVVAQAEFVKNAFELLNDTKYNIKYKAIDISNIDKGMLGNFDIILALCIVYHELKGMQTLINKIADMTGFVIIQANNGHGGELGKYSNHVAIMEAMKKAGFKQVDVDNPDGYLLPLLIGTK